MESNAFRLQKVKKKDFQKLKCDSLKYSSEWTYGKSNIHFDNSIRFYIEFFLYNSVPNHSYVLAGKCIFSRRTCKRCVQNSPFSIEFFLMKMCSRPSTIYVMHRCNGNMIHTIFFYPLDISITCDIHLVTPQSNWSWLAVSYYH